MALAYNPLTRDGRTVADDNEVKVLKAVRYFGHLRRTEVARAVWPHSSHRSAYLMALRTVKRMLDKGHLLERSNTLGGMSLLLGAKGVARLRELDISAVEGYDMSSVSGPQFFHRTMGSCFLIDRSRNEEAVFGEYAINRNWAPLTLEQLKTRYLKIPDGITVSTGKARGYSADFKVLDWLEVESAFKAEAELLKIIRLGLRLPEEVLDMPGLVLDQVVFVYDSRQGHESRILRVLRGHLRANPDDNHAERLSHIVFARAHIDVPMQWHGVSELNAWDMLNGGTNVPADPMGVAISEEEPGSLPTVPGTYANSESDVDDSFVDAPEVETPASWGGVQETAPANSRGRRKRH